MLAACTEVVALDDGPAAGTAAEAVVAVKQGDSELGPILTDADGFTLYAFTEDVGAVSSCYGDCAETWPPVLVEDFTVGAGLESSLFTATHRDDDTHQLAVRHWPLYTFADDESPGDINGQGRGGVWFAVAPDGRLIGAPVAPPRTPTPNQGGSEQR